MENVKFEIKDRVGIITLNRPDKRNALDYQTVSELKQVFLSLGNTSESKVLLLRGEGSSFCAGADLKAIMDLQNNSFQDNLEDSTHLMELYKIMYSHSKIIIGAVNGHAIAGGAGLVTVCDFCFADPEAVFGYPETRIGFVPALVSTFLLRKVGETRAKELLITGTLVSAEKAHQYHLINDVSESGKVEEMAMEFALKLCQKTAATALSATKKVIESVQNLGLSDALNFAAQINAKSRQTDECKLGIKTFFDGKKVEW